jgi:hypothetical protein
LDGTLVRRLTPLYILLALALLLTGVAQAHTLSAKRARHAANAYAARLEIRLEGGYRHSAGSCRRRSAHVRRCHIRVLTAADNPQRCDEAVLVKFRGPRSLRTRVVPLERTFRCFVQR